MGTNYYHRTNICEHCERFDSRHIGKSSAGWTFSFRGYKPWDDESQESVESYEDWLEVLKRSGQIVNEYGEQVSLEEFEDMVESKRNSESNHTLYCQIHHPEHAAKACWLDEDGNSFQGSEFS